MDTTANIIKIINLLVHRHSMTPREIAIICDVSLRTVFRYVNKISNANIPIYYDKLARGYRIEKKGVRVIDNFSAEDLIFMCIGLTLLSKSVDDSYSRDIDDLFFRILPHQNMPNEDVWKEFENKITQDIDSKNLSDTITTLIIHSAICFNKDLGIDLTESLDDNKKVKIKSPSIRFKEGWQILGKNPNEDNVIPFSRIKRVNIL